MNNTVSIIGNVGQDPKVKEFESGKKVANFSVAVKDYSAKDDKPMWLEVEAWNELAERVLKILSKGREVAVTGRLSLASYKQNDGTAVTKPVIIMSGFHACGKQASQ
jgi:single-strand DNA-binding protein